MTYRKLQPLRGRFKTGISFALGVALLAGCGGSQPPIGVPYAILQNHAVATQAYRSGSWMLPEAKNEDLIYVSQITEVSVFSYPRGRLVGSLDQSAFGICSDKHGNVFAVDQETQTVVEYAHGGTIPIATLDDSGNWPSDCSADPNSEDVAVSGGIGHGLGPTANVAIFKGAKGPPLTYVTQYAYQFPYCTYDDHGDVFLTSQQGSGGALAELPSGSQTFRFINIDHYFRSGAAVAWDGRHVVLATPSGVSTGPQTVLMVKVLYSIGKIVKALELSSGTGKKDLHADTYGLAVHRDTIIYENVVDQKGIYES